MRAHAELSLKPCVPDQKPQPTSTHHAPEIGSFHILRRLLGLGRFKAWRATVYIHRPANNASLLQKRRIFRNIWCYRWWCRLSQDAAFPEFPPFRNRDLALATFSCSCLVAARRSVVYSSKHTGLKETQFVQGCEQRCHAPLNPILP